MRDTAKGGNDILTGGNSDGGGRQFVNTLYGDAFDMHDQAQGGDDTLIGGENNGSARFTQDLVGDAFRMRGSSEGGNDRLISGTNTTDEMWGDAKYMYDSATGGSDTFVFKDEFGDDLVYDFDQTEGDKIEFQVAKVYSVDDLDIDMVGDNTVISFDDEATLADDTVTLVDYDNDANPLMPSGFNCLLV